MSLSLFSALWLWSQSLNLHLCNQKIDPGALGDLLEIQPNHGLVATLGHRVVTAITVAGWVL